MSRFVALAAAVFVLSLASVPAEAATTYRTYSSTFSSSRGTAKITVYTNRAGSLALTVKSMTPGSWAVAVHRGTCRALSSKIMSLPSLSIRSSRKAARTNGISAAVMARFRGQRVAVRLTRGSSVVCATFATIHVPSSSAATPATPSTPSNCQVGYSPCLPIVSDLDCPDVRAMGKAPVRVTGSDPYRLDADNDGIGCE